MELGKYSNKERVIYLDSLRGFAILLVVVGHLIQRNYTDGIENPLFNIIYSFHMPLFFFLSGCTCSLSSTTYEDKTWKEWCKTYLYKKIRNFIIPCLTWVFLVPALFNIYENYHIEYYKVYWFLYTLFTINVIWSVILKIRNKWIIGIFVMTVILLFVGGLKRVVMMYMIMYMVGYAFQKKCLIDKISPHVYLVFLLFFMMTVGYFRYGTNAGGSPERVWLEFPLSLAISAVLMKVFKEIQGNMDFLVKMGQYSLQIYLLHFLMVDIPPICNIQMLPSQLVQFIILMSISVALSACCELIAKMIEPIKFLSTILFGK